MMDKYLELDSVEAGNVVEYLVDTKIISDTGIKRSNFLEVVRANKISREQYVEEQAKKLLVDIFSTPAGVKMLKKDVDCAVESLITHSVRRDQGYISLELSESSSYSLVRVLYKINVERTKNDMLRYNAAFLEKLGRFVEKQLMVFTVAIAEKTGLEPRDCKDRTKYKEGSFFTVKTKEGSIPIYGLQVWW